MKATPEIWDAHADWWQSTFANGADPEYENEIMPLVARMLGSAKQVVDIGCGEGQVSRYLTAHGDVERVIGIDPSMSQLANAIKMLPDELTQNMVTYICGRAEQIPLATSSVDAAVCCLVIEHTEDPDAVLAEAARVISPGGRFLIVINHPLFQGTGSGLVDDHILGEQYWRVGPYLAEDVAVEEVDDGVFLPFAHRPLSRYLNPLARLDLVVVDIAEPAPRFDLVGVSVAPDLEVEIPRLLALLFEHRPAIKRSRTCETGFNG